MSDHIPPEVLSDILAKLSPAAIVRCTTVCKSWYSLITSPVFVSLHAQRIVIKKSGLFLVTVRNYKLNADTFSLNFDDDSLSEYKRLDLSLIRNNFKVVDCLNGVVCLWDYKDDNIVLWNPTTRKFLELPKPIVPLDPKKSSAAIGFGYNASNNDFKVIRCLDYDQPELYELSLGRWRTIEPKGDVRVISRYTNQALLNGTVHWVGNNYNDDGIVLFNFRNETFGTIDMPYYFTDRHKAGRLRVFVMGESLSFIYCTERCFVWVMKEYGVADSWTKLYNVSNRIDPWEVLCIRRNGEPLLTDTNDKKALYTYIPNRKLVRHVKLFESERFGMVNFTGSLALLGVKGAKQTMKKTVTEDKDAISEGSSSYFEVFIQFLLLKLVKLFFD